MFIPVADLNFRLVPIGMEADGVDVDALEVAVEREFRKRSSKSETKSGKFW
jgi:DNA-binding transcriptional MocR family regulator